MNLIDNIKILMISKLKVFAIKFTEKLIYFKYLFYKKYRINYSTEFKKIALISTKPLGIGDLIMTTPFIKSLRNEFINSRIDLITDKNIFDKINEINKIHIVKGSIFSINKQFKNLSNEKYDLAIIMQRGVNQYFYAKSLKSKFILGYFSGFNVSSNFNLKVTNLYFNKNEHFSYMSLKIARALGISENKNLITPKYSKDNINKAKKIFENLKLNKNKKTIVINPYVLWESRRWNENNYIELIKKIYKDFNIILYGGFDSINICDYIEKEVRKEEINIYNLSNKMSIKISICFLKFIDLFVTSDSGPMHFALMNKITTIALFGPVKPEHRLPLTYTKTSYYLYLWAGDYISDISIYNYESIHMDINLDGLNMIPVNDVKEKIYNFFKNNKNGN